MFATTSATRMFLKKAALQGAKTTAARAFGTQAASVASAVLVRMTAMMITDDDGSFDN